MGTVPERPVTPGLVAPIPGALRPVTTGALVAPRLAGLAGTDTASGRPAATGPVAAELAATRAVAERTIPGATLA